MARRHRITLYLTAIVLSFVAVNAPHTDAGFEVGFVSVVTHDPVAAGFSSPAGEIEAPPVTTPLSAPQDLADDAIPPPPAEFQGPVAQASPPAQLRQAPPAVGRPGTWAVVVGIDDYPGTAHDLRFAVSDADSMVQVLGHAGVPREQVLYLRNGSATAAGIEGALSWLAANAGPDALAVFFFAGHIRKEGPWTESLVAADGRSVSDRTLAAWFRRVPANQAWIALAGCYAGGFTEVLAPGRILTGAAPADRVAYENSAYSGSYLAHFMLRKAMLEQGVDTIQAAFEHARVAIEQEHPDRVPVQFDHSGRPLRLRQSGASGGASEPPPPPPPSSPQPQPQPQPQPEPEPGPPPKNCSLVVVCTS